MTLDKAIEVYEFWANTHERDAEYHRPLGYAHESTANVAEMQAREERQFAEWLKELKAYRETYPYGVEGYPPRAEPSNSEIPNNCEHITEDGVTCAKYPACDDCLDNPLNKIKGSKRLLKGKDEPTISKMEQVEDKPQTNADQHVQHVGSVEPMQTEREGE